MAYELTVSNEILTLQAVTEVLDFPALTQRKMKIFSYLKYCGVKNLNTIHASHIFFHSLPHYYFNSVAIFIQHVKLCI